MAQHDIWASVENHPNGGWDGNGGTIDYNLNGEYDGLNEEVQSQLEDSVSAEVWSSVDVSVKAEVESSVGEQVVDHIEDNVRNDVESSVADRLGRPPENHTYWSRLDPRHRAGFWRWQKLGARLRAGVKASARAYQDASELAFYYFFDVYLAPNEFHALCQFNERVSGYWLGKEHALIIRRPRVLTRAREGRLHNETGKCIEYHDGWGIYAWYGVRVPEKVILAPETLTREDFLNEENVEVRRVIQERMGQRFVPELGGVVLDSSPRGTLYEVALPEDPEGVARYVQLQDASTERQYFLRVPPTIQTAAEAVAWSFGLSAQEYHPTDET